MYRWHGRPCENVWRKEKMEMKNKKFEEGTVIKGKDLKGYTYGGVLRMKLPITEIQDQPKMDESEELTIKETGFQFYPIQDICDYLTGRVWIAIVEIPDDEDVYVDKKGFHANNLILKEVMSLNEISTWKYLVENGADITASDDFPLRYAASFGNIEVIKYLHENGADLTVGCNHMLNMAAEKGYLEVVKYLHMQGIGVAAENYAVEIASYYGHLEIVKYLYEHGADITAQDNFAFTLAAKKGHLEIVKYLHENGADITVQDNIAYVWAVKAKHMEVANYLRLNGAGKK